MGDACNTKVEKVNFLWKEFCENNIIDLVSHDSISVKGNLNKGKLHFNDTGISRFARSFRDFLNIFETTWHESTHNPFNVSSSSSLSGSPTLLTIDNDLSKIQQQRIMYAKSTIIDHLNINSIRNKFDTLDNIVKTFDIFVISESKLNNTFPVSQFAIGGSKDFGRDRNRFEGDLILYIKENIPCKSLSHHPMFSDPELMAFELYQSKRKWLFLAIYKSPSQNDIEFLGRISLILDHNLPTYENFVVIEDFNLPVEKNHLKAVIQAYDLSSLIKKPPYYQFHTLSCIDLILTNKKHLNYLTPLKLVYLIIINSSTLF